jgi:hypothetical protein
LKKNGTNHATLHALLCVSSYANDKPGAVILIEALQGPPFFKKMAPIPEKNGAKTPLSMP